MNIIAVDQRFWDRVARKYASDPIKDVAGYERTLARTTSFLNPTDRVFEFGCGTGTTALKLASHVDEIESTDISAEMIAIAKEKADSAKIRSVSFRQATLGSPLLAEENYDVALGFNTLHLLRDLPDSLRQIRRILKPGGLFISKTPCLSDANILIQWFVPLARAIGKAPYVAIFTAQELLAAIESAGFEIVEQEKHGSNHRDFRSYIVARKPALPSTGSLWSGLRHFGETGSNAAA